MSRFSDLATDHQRRRELLTEQATVKALRQFRRIDVADLDGGWNRVAPTMVAAVSAAQVQAASQADPYSDRVANAWGDSAGRARVVPESFSGVMLDGRELGPAMYGAVTTTKTLIGKGMQAGRAFEVGASILATIVGAAVQDMGRQADETTATGRGYTRYVRVVSAGACSRCAILAGSGDYRKPFERHPRCKCTSMPVQSGKSAPKGFHDSPDDYFDSLSRAEQDRIFTTSGAEAIRSGADPIRVVNARRGVARRSKPELGRKMRRTKIGARPDGRPIMGITTSDGAYRGAFRSTQRDIDSVRYAVTKRKRLMPETIMELADDLPTRQLLLRDAGYLDMPITDLSSNSWISKQVDAQRADRAAADAFYRKLGISLG